MAGMVEAEELAEFGQGDFGLLGRFFGGLGFGIEIGIGVGFGFGIGESALDGVVDEGGGGGSEFPALRGDGNVLSVSNSSSDENRYSIRAGKWSQSVQSTCWTIRAR